MFNKFFKLPLDGITGKWFARMLIFKLVCLPIKPDRSMALEGKQNSEQNPSNKIHITTTSDLGKIRALNISF